MKFFQGSRPLKIKVQVKLFVRWSGILFEILILSFTPKVIIVLCSGPKIWHSIFCFTKGRSDKELWRRNHDLSNYFPFSDLTWFQSSRKVTPIRERRSIRRNSQETTFEQKTHKKVRQKMLLAIHSSICFQINRIGLKNGLVGQWAL